MSNTYESKVAFKLTKKRYVLIGLFVVAILAALYRYYIGLSTTNLSDSYPWGLWIAVDLAATALACVGFSMTLVSKIFHRKEFSQLTKRAILMALLFYVLISMVLLVEIGRWDNFWRPFASPGTSSPMFLVLLCVAVYTFLLILEASEIIGEKVGFKYLHKIKKVIPFVAILACAVPIAYQASLGSIYFAMDGKLNLLWATPLMPLFFILSAFLVGFAVMIIESLTIARFILDDKVLVLLHKLSKIAMITSVVFFLTKVLDVIFRGAGFNLFTVEGLFFILELVLISLLPTLIYFSGFGKSKKGLLLFSLSMVVGLILTRTNVIFIGMSAYLGGGYYPSFVEIITTLGFSAFVVFMYLIFIDKFKLLEK